MEKINIGDKHYFVKKKITSKDACRIIACQPAQTYFKEQYKRFHQKNFLKKFCKDIQKNYDKILQTIIEIEKKLYKLNKYRSKKIVVALAVYLCTSSDQEEASDFADCSSVSLRTLALLLGYRPALSCGGWKKR